MVYLDKTCSFYSISSRDLLYVTLRSTPTINNLRECLTRHLQAKDSGGWVTLISTGLVPVSMMKLYVLRTILIHQDFSASDLLFPRVTAR